jgi:alpha-beta hydrolase superfamily lysophospholipase
METRADSFEINTDDGHRISDTLWPGVGLPNSVIQIFHGLGEHPARYRRFAVLANASGFAVVCHDHSGHGRHAHLVGYFADKDGWQRLVSDGTPVTRHMKN